MAGGAKKKRVARRSKKKASTRDVVADLTDDVLVDILSRLPIKSLCRSKLVSTRWRNLISHPEHRKKLPHTLTGFFYESYDRNRFPKSLHFTNVSRAVDPFIDPSLSFLPEYKRIDIRDGCNGLLLCHCWKPTDPVTIDSVVCNPATEKWVVVPDSGWSSKVRVHLAFDPAVSSHFHVFEFIPDDFWYVDEVKDFDGRTEVVAVYSSKTGVWSFNENDDLPIDKGYFAMPHSSRSVFFNGLLYLATLYSMVIAIDVEGKVLRCIPFPTEYENDDPCYDVYLSQGHLYLITISDEFDGYQRQRSVWFLEGRNSDNWTLKYKIDPCLMFGAHYYSEFGDFFSVMSIHPEHDTMFMVCGGNTVMSYEMDHMRLRFVSELGRCCKDSYIPYVPLFLESLADDEQ